MIVSMATIRELLNYHYDRRERLYRFLEELSPAELTRDVKVGWQSIQGILLHALEAEAFWVQYALQKRERPDWDFGEFPDIPAIRRQAARVREQTEAYLATLSEADLGREAAITYSSGAETRFTIAKALMHVILHDAHHRGQASTLARQLGYEPPEIDLM
ncbi:MAG: DinB family protein [Bacillota bacterium]